MFKINSRVKRILLVLNFLLLFVLVYFSAIKEESYRKKEFFYLKLVPVDPRSLMQGDYMTLNYEITKKALSKVGLLNQFWKKNSEKKGEFLKKGYIVVSLDKDKLAHYKDVVKKPFSNNENLLFIAFRSNGYNIKINADTFFFQEGDANLYQNAKYSKVVIVDNHLRLISLADKLPKKK